MMQRNKYGYGVADQSYIAAGQLAGVTALVDAFYDNMSAFPEAEKIRKMHPEDLSESRKKLTYFLSGWLGGPRLYAEHYGAINIPGVHQHLEIGDAERDAWLFCMQQAIMVQPYTTAFKQYLFAQISIPAERIKQVKVRQAQSG